jgi:hypothetical protein
MKTSTSLSSFLVPYHEYGVEHMEAGYGIQFGEPEPVITTLLPTRFYSMND